MYIEYILFYTKMESATPTNENISGYVNIVIWNSTKIRADFVMFPLQKTMIVIDYTMCSSKVEYVGLTVDSEFRVYRKLDKKSWNVSKGLRWPCIICLPCRCNINETR